MIYVVAGLYLLSLVHFYTIATGDFRQYKSLIVSHVILCRYSDQRIISVFQTIIVTLIVSTLRSFFRFAFHFRDSNLLMLHLHLLISDVLKENFVFTVWKPIAAIFWLALAFSICCIAVLKKFFLFIRSRVLFLHAWKS